MKRIATMSAVVAMSLPASALAAGNSTCQAYNPQTCISTRVHVKDPTLPFTGIDVGLLVAGGGGLLGAGLFVRRFSALNTQ